MSSSNGMRQNEKRSGKRSSCFQSMIDERTGKYYHGKGIKKNQKNEEVVDNFDLAETIRRSAERLDAIVVLYDVMISQAACIRKSALMAQ